MKHMSGVFSKKGTEEKPDPVIVADYREKISPVVSEIIGLGIRVDFKELKVADYIVNDVAIERKTVPDFLSSMTNRRLINQLEGMQQYGNRILLIEGLEETELYHDGAGIHPNSVRGFLVSILLKYRVPIIFTKNCTDTASFISILAKRRERELSLNVSRKSLDKKERMQFILESFSGIGPKTARKLLERFGTLKKIFNAGEGELKKTIGKKASVFRIVDQGYGGAEESRFDD